MVVKLAHHGHSVHDIFCWDVLPAFIREDFFRDWYGFPIYCFP